MHRKNTFGFYINANFGYIAKYMKTLNLFFCSKIGFPNSDLESDVKSVLYLLEEVLSVHFTPLCVYFLLGYLKAFHSTS